LPGRGRGAEVDSMNPNPQEEINESKRKKVKSITGSKQTREWIR
jgi:hypothetical protein